MLELFTPGRSSAVRHRDRRCCDRGAFNAPSWLALLAGLAIAIASRIERPKQAKLVTTLALQLGVMRSAPA